MLRSLATLLLMQVLGEGLVRLAGLPVPGPVMGLVLLFAWLQLTGGPSEDLERVGSGLLSVLALLFVPAGVGVIAHLDLFAQDAAGIALALTLGTWTAIAVSAWVFARVSGARE